MKLSVLQWNVWYKEDIEHIAAELKRIDADVVCLQELTLHYEDQSHDDTIAYLSNELGYHVYASEPMGREDVARKQLNAIFSRYPLTDQIQGWINTPIGTGGASDEFRAYVEASIMVGKTKLRIATTHMSYIDRFTVTDRKQLETDRLVGFIKDKAPLILAGDLNAPPESYVVQQIERHLKNAGPGYDQMTWTTKPFVYHDFVENDLVWRLDYIFATPNLQVASTEILDSPYSDHLPVLTVFNID